jgi:hypothetical protein
MNRKRFDIFFERHLGIGIRWCSDLYQLEISLAIPFVTFVIGLGREK